MTKNENGKVLYLDILRLFAALCVIMLHCVTYYIGQISMYATKTWYICLILNEINRCGVPLFLMISGFLAMKNFQNGNIIYFYKKRFPRVLIPFIVWDIFYFIYYHLSDKKIPFVKEFFSDLIIGGSSYHLWYVYTITAIYLLTPFLIKLISKCGEKQLWWLFILIIFPGTIRPLINTFLPVYMYLFDGLIENYIGYFLLGYILGKTELKFSYRIIIYAGGFIGFIYGILYNYFSSSAESIPLPANGGYGINHYLCAAALFVFVKKLPEIKNPFVIKFVMKLSDVSYGVYLSHVLFIEIFKKSITFSLTPAVEIIFCFITVTLLSFAISYILSRIKYLNRIIL